jgi:hypothetical protein
MNHLKKGSRINTAFLHNFEDKPVWVEFDCSDITMLETDEATNDRIDELNNQYQDGWYRVLKSGFGGYSLHRIKPNGLISNELPLSSSHNLIDGIYSVDEDEE